MAVVLITGGARSGKSSFAEEMCKERGEKACYIATAKAVDIDMEIRIQKHRKQRPETWITVEQYCDFDRLPDNETFKTCDTFLLDCITIMITNIMFDSNFDFDNCSNNVIDGIEKDIIREIEKLLLVMKQYNKQLFLVTNEIGMGVVSAYRLGNIFRDIAGRINQLLAREADEVYNIICGIPQKLK